MSSSDCYSVEYNSQPPSTSRKEDNNNILLPGQQPQEEDHGIVITPTPTQIVIKTRLVKDPFTDDSPRSRVPYISAMAQTQVEETKLFLNVCTHSIIALPSQRKTLDEKGEQVEGWRLPMAMGDIRPFYDKAGNACIAADCIVNPKIVQDMRTDSSHFHFVCDLIIQCAERKFQHTTCFGGKGLERSFKLPKMKYAAYVDEETNLSILPKAVEESSSDNSLDNPPRPVVAKQRVKGSGGRVAMIEEVECLETQIDSKDDPSQSQLSKVRIELFVTTKEEDRGMIPLFDFLREADMDPSSSSPSTLRKMIQSPPLKPCEEENLSKSQLLKIPLPIKLKDGEVKSIVAKCHYRSALTKSDLPTINASAFLLTISKTEMNSVTECVLPFAVDTHQTSARYETKSGVFEINMPVLQSALNFEQNADPGTRQWEIQNAFRVKSVHANPQRQCDDETRAPAHAQSEDEDILPEDAFHSLDIMSCHLLQQQKEMQKSQQQKSASVGRRGADTEYIDVNGGKHIAKEEASDSLLQKAGGNLAFGLV